jgi:hypothetical protein
MFKSISFTHMPGIGPAVDIGQLAEALLFYGQVNVVANPATLTYLCLMFHPRVLAEYIRQGYLNVFYTENRLAIHTLNSGSTREIHQQISFTSPALELGRQLRRGLEESGHDMSQVKILTSQLKRLIRAFSYEKSNADLFDSLVADREFLSSTAKRYCELWLPNTKLASDFSFVAERQADGLVIHTNAEFAALNAEYHKRVSVGHSSISPAYLLATVQNAVEDFCVSAQLDSDISANPINIIASDVKLKGILRLSGDADAQIDMFSSSYLGDVAALGNAVRAGKVSFAQLLKVLEKAEKFKVWLREQDADANVAHEYYKAVSKSTFLEKLPGKSFRWSVFTGVGVAIDAAGAGGFGTSAALAVSAIDAFILDKLVKGWKPNQFINDELAKLLENDSKKGS